jgi:hypothetical protein
LTGCRAHEHDAGRFVVLAEFRAKVDNGQVKERLLDGMLLLLLLDFLLRWLVIVVDLLRRMLERILNSCLISPSESWGSCSFCLWV